MVGRRLGRMEKELESVLVWVKASRWERGFQESLPRGGYESGEDDRGWGQGP